MARSLINNGTKSVPEAEISPSARHDAPNGDERGERASSDRESIALPAHVAGSGTLDRLVDTARDYAKAATSENTLKAYAKDWKHFARWCRLKGTEPLPPSPEMIGLYLTDLAAPSNGSPALSVATIDRRLSGLAWNATQRGSPARSSFAAARASRRIASIPTRRRRTGTRSAPRVRARWTSM